MRSFALVPLVCLLALGCGGDPDPGDGGSPDGGSLDAAPRDAGPQDDAATDSSTPDAGPLGLRLRVLSSRPDQITGTDALVLVEVEDAADEATLHLDDAPVGGLEPFVLPTQRVALVEGLSPGAHTLEARAGGASVQLEVLAHPIEGPVFSGPHEEPFACSTEEFALGAPLDADCSAPTVVAHFRRNAAGEYALIADPSAPPPETESTTTSEGVTVPWVLRVEAGVIDRAIYWISSLYDPERPEPAPWLRPRTFDGRLLAMFGGGCGTGYVQGDPNFTGALNDLVGQGWALMHSSLNILGQNCNDVLSAEAAMMVKERFVESFGPPSYTVGFGGSGGSIQQHLIADNYPGLLDGLVTLISYPDIFSVLPDIVDCVLLDAVFDADPGTWDDAARRAVTGFASELTCDGWISILGGIFDPSAQCDPRMPADAIYDASARPDGARCTIQDHNVNIFGADAMGRARRAYANRGVQYGLAALEAGAIDPEAFVALNEAVGSLDLDGQPAPARDPGDDEAVRRAYATGRVLDGGQGLGAVPILDMRAFTDRTGDFHDSVRTLSTRARLDAANGDHGNHVSFIAAPNPPAVQTQALIEGFVALDAWVAAFAADPDPDRAAAARRSRPADLGDRCYETTIPRDGPCDDVFPPSETPRLVAGAPIANDVLQCALTELRPEDYGVTFTAAQLARLRAVFPDGVCDWDAPPPNRVPHDGPWQSF